jgi:two-component system phosphate regulon sensor histidine kinase PhoR
VDREERVVLMTGVARRLLDIAAEGSVGRKIWEITRVPDVLETLGASLREGRSLSGELVLAKSPRDQVIEYQVAPIRDGAGATTGAVLVLHDVSELRKMDQVRRDFVANVSHELKTPLTAIRGSVETVLDDPDMDPDTARRFLTMIRENTSRLSALVTDLLALSRIESEEAAFRSRPVDVREPVLDSVRRLGPMAAARSIALAAEVGAAPVLALGEREAIVEIADNLVTNALQYTRPGGTVAVRLRRDADAVLLEVEDTGIGIDAEHLDRIFERFYRVDKARSREVGGTGLGLSIVKHLVQAMQGAVSVTSQPGAGTTFTVRLRPQSGTST